MFVRYINCLSNSKNLWTINSCYHKNVQITILRTKVLCVSVRALRVKDKDVDIHFVAARRVGRQKQHSQEKWLTGWTEISSPNRHWHTINEKRQSFRGKYSCNTTAGIDYSLNSFHCKLSIGFLYTIDWVTWSCSVQRTHLGRTKTVANWWDRVEIPAGQLSDIWWICILHYNFNTPLDTVP